MQARQSYVWLSCIALALLGAAPLPEVTVVNPLSREVADHEDFTGRTEATSSVVIRARVTGFIDKVSFKDGSDVRKGDVLFEIDPRPYQAELAKTEAGLSLSETRLKRTEADLKRAMAVFRNGSMSQEEYAKIVGDNAEAKEGVRLAKTVLSLARLNLDFTKVTAPIDGRIGRRLLDAGNLVKADETVLATIVTLDPVYVYFSIGERTFLGMMRMMQEGKLKAKGWERLPVAMGLADEKGLSHHGMVDFADNRMDPQTGTIRVRAVFPNTEKLMMPGLYARVRLTTGESYKALLIPDRVVMIEKGEASVFVVNEKNVVEKRQIKLGSLEDDLLVVKEGVGVEDRVVLDRKGLRAGMKVKPKKEKENSPR